MLHAIRRGERDTAPLSQRASSCDLPQRLQNAIDESRIIKLGTLTRLPVGAQEAGEQIMLSSI
jgi:hypothetical protein